MTTDNHQPTEEEKKQIYDFYKLIFSSSFSKQKKINLVNSLFLWEPWSWRVVGITINALKEFKKNDFKYKSRTFSRDHFIQDRKVTINHMLDEILPLQEWWSLFWRNDQTIIVTQEEHSNKLNSEISSIVDIDYKLGYFVCGNLVGFSYSKKREGKFLEKLIDDNNLDL
tara:strand:- start:598 stop:1104 length:507 start_codon:yes stop_codon:yes gene_type:complete